MKKVLIYNGNDKGYYDFIADEFIKYPSQNIVDVQNFFNVNFVEEDSYIIYVPTVFTSSSAMSYSGVEFALWIYMFMLLKHNNKFHIVLLGSETKGAFFEHCKYANIILSRNVHYVLNNKQNIECFLANTDITKYENKECLIDSLKRVKVEAPVAFKNAHTITNEWCVYRWSKAIGIDLPNNNVENSLYFTYLKAILSLDNIPKVNNVCMSKNKVLVVDDEMDKGWRIFFESLLSGHVKCIGEDFKKANNREIIIEEVTKTVEEYDPDIVILDLRLHELDHNNNDAKVKLTGVKILEEIKRINKGIQVIGFTASNKVWNLLAWQNCGIDGFIVKESPIKSIEVGYTEKSIKQLMDAIENAASKSYLKEIYRQNHAAMERLRFISNKTIRLLDRPTANGIIGYLRLAQSSLFATKPNHDTAFMYYFLILEAFAKIMIDDEGIQGDNGDYYIKFRREDRYLYVFNEKSGEKTFLKLSFEKTHEKQHNRIPYAQKFYNMIDYAGIKGLNAVQLVKIRNEFNHPNFIDSKPIVLNYQNVIDIMNVVCSLINNYK